MKRLTVIFILAALFLCACTPSEIPPEPVVSEDSTVTSAPEKVTEGTTATTLSPEEILEDRTIMSELYGSFLTMRMTGTVNEALDGNYVKVFNNYAEIDGYFSSTDPYYFYGQKFISTLASFDDVFQSQNDVMIVKIDEPSSYISHQNARVRIEDGVLNVGIERHIPPHAPESDTQYHLILTAAKGTFAGLEDLPLQVNITEVIAHGHDTAAAADRYLNI